MTKNKHKKLNILMLILLTTLIVPITIKATTDLALANFLINTTSLTNLLAASQLGIFNGEFLFKLAIAFSDFNFNANELINIITLFDVLPFLAVLVIFEVNRISKKSKDLNSAILVTLLIYIVKYMGLGVVVGYTILNGYNFVLGFNYLGYFMFFIAFAFIFNGAYLIYAYNNYRKKDYITWK